MRTPGRGSRGPKLLRRPGTLEEFRVRAGRGLGSSLALAGAIFGIVGVLPAHADPAVPAGMVPYDHPFYKNGRLVLWHGPNRGATPAASPDPAGETRPLVVLVDADDARAPKLASDLVAAMGASKVAAKVLSERTGVAALAKASKGETIDFAIAPLPPLISDPAAAPIKSVAPSVARLGAEPIEIVASKRIANVAALEGLSVDVGPPDSSGAATLGVLFSRLGVTPKISHYGLAQALPLLAAGKLDAVAVAGAARGKPLDDFGHDGSYHLVAVTWTPALQGLFAPLSETNADRPYLVAPNETAETVAAPLALVAVNPGQGARFDHLAQGTKAMYESFAHSAVGWTYAGWRDVNFAAEIQGWPRFQAVSDWLAEQGGASDASLDGFRAAAQTAVNAGDGPGADDADRLYGALMRWRGSSQ